MMDENLKALVRKKLRGDTNTYILTLEEYDHFRDEIEDQMCGRFYGHWCYGGATIEQLEKDFTIHKAWYEATERDFDNAGDDLVNDAIDDLLEKDLVICILAVDDETGEVVDFSEMIFGKEDCDQDLLANYQKAEELFKQGC